MNEELLNPLSPCRYICNDQGVGEQEPESQEPRKSKNSNNDNTITAELVKPIPRIFSSPRKVNDFLDSISLDEVGSAEHWFRCGVKIARDKYLQKKFSVKRTTFEERVAPFLQEELAEMQQQQMRSQGQNQAITQAG